MWILMIRYVFNDEVVKKGFLGREYNMEKLCSRKNGVCLRKNKYFVMVVYFGCNFMLI